MNALFQDIRFGARTLIKNPLFTLVAVCSLGIGIGAVSTVYSLISSTMLHPTPFENSDRIMAVENISLQGGGNFSVAYPQFLDWQEQNEVFAHMAAYSGGSFNFMGPEGPEHVAAGRVTHGFLPALGVRPVLGRTFLPEEDEFGNANVVMLSHHLWISQFDENPDVVDSTITLDGESFTVVGVVPADFRFLDVGNVDVWVPVATAPWGETRGNHWLNVVARLDGGVSMEQAAANMAGVADAMREQYPDQYIGRGIGVSPFGQTGGASDLRVAFIILLGAVAFVLLISCGNVANLLLARVAARKKEVTIRIALGASRWRLVRQLLTESVLLATLGGAAGVLITYWGQHLVTILLPSKEAQFYIEYFEFGMNPEIFGITALVALSTGFLFGVVPALQASNPDLNEALKDGSGAAGGGRKRHRTLNALVVAEVALALVLLISAGLMIQSFQNLQEVDPGFEPSGILTIATSLPEATYPENAQVIAFHEQLEEQARSLGQVEFIGATSVLPMSNSNSTTSVAIEGLPEPEPGTYYHSGHRRVTPGYMDALGVPLISGRALTLQDRNSEAPVALVNDAMVRRYWPGEDAVGKRFRVGGYDSEAPWHVVVGVVGDVRHSGFEEEPAPEFYMANAQNPGRYMITAIRTKGDPTALAAEIRQIVQGIDPNQPLYNVQTMGEYVDFALWPNRFTTVLFGALAGIALLLATVGVYGVISYMVSQRTHEIGIRMALGAHAGSVRGLVVRSGLKLAIIGVVIGLPMAFGLTRVLSSMLYGVSAADPLVFAAITALMICVALLASYMPARRATLVDPIIALRYE